MDKTHSEPLLLDVECLHNVRVFLDLGQDFIRLQMFSKSSNERHGFEINTYFNCVVVDSDSFTDLHSETVALLGNKILDGLVGITL